jgi:hypothetical protein
MVSRRVVDFIPYELPPLPDVKTGTIVQIKNQQFKFRELKSISAGCHVDGATLPTTDDDLVTMLNANIKRICSKRNDIHNNALKAMMRYGSFFVKQFKPLDVDVDLSVETWLGGTSYTESEKKYLLELNQKIDNTFKEKFMVALCFMKEESYLNITKDARGIFSRTDALKTLIGPLIKQIENEVYKHKSFIKHVPVAERPAFIKDYLDTFGNVGESDYTAFESHFDEQFMELTDFLLFRHMTKSIVSDKKKIPLQFSGQNILKFRDFMLKIQGTRLSGEMTTSLFNGFANLFFLSFVYFARKIYKLKTGRILNSFEEFDIEFTESDVRENLLKCVVEGDDGLAIYNDGVPSEQLYKECGLKMKLEVKQSLETASFCGIVFDSDALDALTDIRKHLVKTAWLSSRYVLSKQTKQTMLLRAKAFSIVHQYPNCPVLRAYGDYILRMTKHQHKAMMDYVTKVRFTDRYEYEMFLKYANTNLPPNKPIHPGSRLVVEELFKVSVAEQLQLEKYFNTCAEIKPIPYELVQNFIDHEWLYYDMYYTATLPVQETRDSFFTYPVSLKNRKRLPTAYRPENLNPH